MIEHQRFWTSFHRQTLQAVAWNKKPTGDNNAGECYIVHWLKNLPFLEIVMVSTCEYNNREDV